MSRSLRSRWLDVQWWLDMRFGYDVITLAICVLAVCVSVAAVVVAVAA